VCRHESARVRAYECVRECGKSSAGWNGVDEVKTPEMSYRTVPPAIHGQWLLVWPRGAPVEVDFYEWFRLRMCAVLFLKELTCVTEATKEHEKRGEEGQMHTGGAAHRIASGGHL
jgi:hypothetical protein